LGATPLCCGVAFLHLHPCFCSMLSKELLFFISTLGWFNGLFLSVYFLFFAPPKKLANRLLGVLLLCLSARIGKSVVWYFTPDMPVIYIQLGLAVCFFIGPLLYLYMETAVGPKTAMTSGWKRLLALHLLFVLVLLVFFTQPEHLPLWKKYFVRLIYLQWLGFVLVAARFIVPILRQMARGEHIQGHEKWLLAVYCSNLMVVLNYVMALFKILNVAYITGSITFTIVLYANVLIVLYRKKTDDLFGPATPKYQSKKMENAEAAALIARLETIAHTPEFYRDERLKLADVAHQMGISSHQLSQLLNDNLQKNFSTYMHELRIRKACDLMVHHPDLKTEVLGYEVGYQSKSTFFAAFKKVMGTTPAAYREKMVQKQ
jgi:AraC-like DNA-binding protein